MRVPRPRHDRVQNYPLSNNFTAPQFTTAAVNNGTWWVGGLTSVTGYPTQMPSITGSATATVTSYAFLSSTDGVNFNPVRHSYIHSFLPSHPSRQHTVVRL